MEFIKVMVESDDVWSEVEVFGEKLESPKGLEEFEFYVHETYKNHKVEPYTITEKSTGAKVIGCYNKNVAQEKLDEKVGREGIEKFKAACEKAAILKEKTVQFQKMQENQLKEQGFLTDKEISLELYGELMEINSESYINAEAIPDLLRNKRLDPETKEKIKKAWDVIDYYLSL